MKKKKTTRKSRKWSVNKIKSNFLLVRNKEDYGSGKEYTLVHRPKRSSLILEQAGQIGIDRDGYVNSSVIKQKWRGRGIGKYFYEQILLDNKKLCSDVTSASTQAQRVHKSLMKKYEHKVDVFDTGRVIYKPKLLKQK